MFSLLSDLVMSLLAWSLARYHGSRASVPPPRVPFLLSLASQVQWLCYSVQLTSDVSFWKNG